MIVIALLPLYLVVINAFKSHGDIVLRSCIGRTS